MMHRDLNLVFGGRDPTWGASKNDRVSEALEARICLSQQNFDSPGLRFGMEILFLLEQVLY